jgi:hypothetical protein
VANLPVFLVNFLLADRFCGVGGGVGNREEERH